MSKKSFTLIEVLISITIFSFVMITLYQVLDITKKTNKSFESIVVKQQEINDIKNIIISDISQSTSSIKIELDNNLNSKLFFKTSNSFHNPFYSYITYLVSSEKKLLRVESRNYLTKETLDKELETAYVDTLLFDIERFEVLLSKKNSKVYLIKVKQKNKEKFLFSSLQIR